MLPPRPLQVTFSVTDVTINGWVDATFSPSYGIPPTSEAFTKAGLSKVVMKTVVRVDQLCSANSTIVKAHAASAGKGDTGMVTVSAPASTSTETTSSADTTVATSQAMQATWSQNVSSTVGGC